MSRRIKAPGIEINEIDRSGYNEETDNSTIGTAALIYGFSDKGDDYDVKRIYTMDQFKNTYGTPKTEAERYFYNAAQEVIDQTGVLYTSKLPYDNEVLDKVAFTRYKIDDKVTPVSSPYQIATEQISSTHIQKGLYEFLLLPDISYEVAYYIFNEELYEGLRGQTITLDMLKEHYEDYVVEDEHGDIDNTVEMLDAMGIKSKAIDSMFAFIKTNVNFSYEANVEFTELFYDTDGLARNKAAYILSAIYEDNYNYISSVAGLETYPIEAKRDILDEIKDTITDNIKGERYEGFLGIVEKYGKSITIRVYKDFYDTLYSDIESYSDEATNYYRYAMLAIMESFDNLDLLSNSKYTEIPMVDDTLTSYMNITDMGRDETGLLDYDFLDKYLTGALRVKKNTIMICDITRGKYEADDREKEYIGILPVIVSPANAMYYQQLFEKEDVILSDYNVLSGLRNMSHTQDTDGNPIAMEGINGDTSNLSVIGFTQIFGSEKNVTATDYTISQQAAEKFPTIRPINGRLERTYLKQIGVVVFKLYKDYTSDNKIGMLPVESFVGSLDRSFLDPITSQNMFIDDIINDNSEYIRFFSHTEFTKEYEGRKTEIDNARFFVVNNQCSTSLGFYEVDTGKYISVNNSIMNALTRTFANIEDKNKLDIDIIADAGVSNIAQFIASTQPKDRQDKFVMDPMKRIGTFDLSISTAYLFKIENSEHVKVWKSVIRKFDDFCKYQRKDCIFLADGPRQMVLEGNQKVVRRTKTTNTIRNAILPKMKYISGIFNSSYSAGYLNWFYARENSANTMFWLPPSIKAMGVCMYTDLYSNFWLAPAGLNRGVLKNVYDTSFNPTNEEAWDIYENTWNYAVNYPTEGIVIEGQKTFQTNKTALDRINVRRLMLGLEKNVGNVAKYFTYEGITYQMMTRFQDAIEYILEDVKTKGGIVDYVIICDERNNNENTIDNNELHCTIAVKPVKAIEFVILNFVCTNQSANVSEIAESEL